MIGENCTNCRNKWIVNGTYCCSLHPEADDYAVIMTQKKAQSFICDEYIDERRPYCEDCKFHSCMENSKLVCMNLKRADVASDGFINLFSLDEKNETCKYFVKRIEI